MVDADRSCQRPGCPRQGIRTDDPFCGTCGAPTVASVPVPQPMAAPAVGYGRPSPPVTSTILVTFFFGLFGLIPAITNSRKEREAGRDGTRYWKAFWWTLAASTTLAVGAVVALVAALAVATSTVSADSSAAAQPSPSVAADPTSDRDAALSAAKTAVVDLTSYDYRTVNGHLAEVSPEITDAFRATYAKTFGSMSSIVVQNQGVATSTVRNAAVETLTGDTATVLIFLDQTVSTRSVPSRLNESRVEVSLERQSDGRWLVSDLQVRS